MQCTVCRLNHPSFVGERLSRQVLVVIRNLYLYSHYAIARRSLLVLKVSQIDEYHSYVLVLNFYA